MRKSLVAALAASVDLPRRSKARRFLSGLSLDELQFIAGFMGSRILDSAGTMTGYGRGADLKMLILREYVEHCETANGSTVRCRPDVAAAAPMRSSRTSLRTE